MKTIIIVNTHTAALHLPAAAKCGGVTLTPGRNVVDAAYMDALYESNATVRAWVRAGVLEAEPHTMQAEPEERPEPPELPPPPVIVPPAPLAALPPLMPPAPSEGAPANPTPEAPKAPEEK